MSDPHMTHQPAASSTRMHSHTTHQQHTPVGSTTLPWMMSTPPHDPPAAHPGMQHHSIYVLPKRYCLHPPVSSQGMEAAIGHTFSPPPPPLPSGAIGPIRYQRHPQPHHSRPPRDTLGPPHGVLTLWQPYTLHLVAQVQHRGWQQQLLLF